jgi:hypothetical protein
MGRKLIREDGRPLTDAEKAKRYRAAAALRREKAVVALMQARRSAALALKGVDQHGIAALVERLEPSQPVILAVDEGGGGYATITRDLSPAFALRVVRAVLMDLREARPDRDLTDEELMIDDCLEVLARLDADEEDD